MAYEMTLSKSVRDGLDWIGDRYGIGQTADVLRDCLPEDAEWDQEGEITFKIPEHKAWEIKELIESDDSMFPCLADTEAFDRLLNEIV